MVNRKVYYTSADKKGRVKHAYVRAYLKDIPAISLAKDKNGRLTNANWQRQGRTKRGKKTGRMYGVRVGSQYIPGAFINFVQGKEHANIQVMDRNTDKTWRPGEFGWKYGPGEGRHARAKFRVIKYSFNMTGKDVQHIVEKETAEQFGRQFVMASDNEIRKRLTRAARMR